MLHGFVCLRLTTFCLAARPCIHSGGPYCGYAVDGSDARDRYNGVSRPGHGAGVEE